MPYIARHALRAAALGAIFLLAPIGAASAQNAAEMRASPAQPNAARQIMVHRISTHGRETVDERIAKLHTELKVTPDEETKWGDVAQVMRDNGAAIDKLIATETADAPKEPTAVDDLKSYQKFAQAHADGLTNLITAFESFYNAAPPAQQKRADQVFENFGRKSAAAHHKI